MERKLKVITRVKKHGYDEIENQEAFLVITDGENIDQLIQMIYGSWYDVMDYTYEPVEIYVSKKYCHRVSMMTLSNS